MTLSRTPDTLAGRRRTVNGDLTLGAQLGATGTFNYNTAPGDAAMLTINNGALTVGDAGNGTLRSIRRQSNYRWLDHRQPVRVGWSSLGRRDRH